MSANTIRDDSLRQLRFSSYWKYLQSPMWKAISRRVLEKARYRCESCGDRATQVHHRSYDLDTMRGRDFSQLVPLCGVCHEAAEFADNQKADLNEANRRLEKLVNATPIPKPKKALDAWAEARASNFTARPASNRHRPKKRLQWQTGSPIPPSRAPLPNEYGKL